MASFWDDAARTFSSLSILGTIGQAFSQNEAANEQLRQIKLQNDQATIQLQQRSLANYSNTNKILSSQLVNESASGLSLSSPSFNAIERNTANVGARNQRNINIEKSLTEEGYDFERNQVKQKLQASYFGDITDAAKNIAMIAEAF